jgi:signal transduction histidine kinase
MGMNVMQQEIARALGYSSAEELEGILVNQSGRNVKQENKTKNIAITDTQALEWFEIARDILTNSEVATDVLSDFLDFDKIQAGSLQLEWTEVMIWDILTGTLREFKLPADAKGIKLLMLSSMDCECSNPKNGCSQRPTEIQAKTVLGDPVRLTQVLRNCKDRIKYVLLL